VSIVDAKGRPLTILPATLVLRIPGVDPDATVLVVDMQEGLLGAVTLDALLDRLVSS